MSSALNISQLPLALSANSGDYVLLWQNKKTKRVNAEALARLGVSPIFDVHVYLSGLPPASYVLVRVPLARAVEFAANFAATMPRCAGSCTVRLNRIE